MAAKRLGKGLDALLGAAEETAEVTELLLGELQPGKHQPREDMDEEGIKNLAESIKETGILQPVVARKVKGKTDYEIIMGERRWRAAKLAGLKKIPVIVREVEDREALVMALVENVQRKDLNPIEKARAFKRLMDVLSINQTQASQRLGMSRVAVTNTLRLLELPRPVKDMVSSNKLSAGHARALLMVKSPKRAHSLALRIVRDRLSVRQVEQMVGPKRKQTGKKKGQPVKGPHIVAIENELSMLLGTKVKLVETPRGGRLIVEFYDSETLEKITRVIKTGVSRAKSRK